MSKTTWLVPLKIDVLAHVTVDESVSKETVERIAEDQLFVGRTT